LAGEPPTAPYKFSNRVAGALTLLQPQLQLSSVYLRLWNNTQSSTGLYAGCSPLQFSSPVAGSDLLVGQTPSDFLLVLSLVQVPSGPCHVLVRVMAVATDSHCSASCVGSLKRLHRLSSGSLQACRWIQLGGIQWIV